ncbi:endolytic transglycosylase MltG [Mangrovicoccus algicola]|uniref:Endolytic murein transglycosylase n=1 Tax=Mangrovicoccus algicola TaxID=2771008 RepID=A0A8J6YW96_9RHOB|nr:endolytic transglycosylase MltG [Mangrovicoccus algicola]MBE3636951.1 endolytic transglycosylase MltG [Mangrovicoccus algicola]
MWKSVASNFLTLLIVALMALSGAIYWAQRSWVTPGPLAEAVCVSVPRGGTMTGVSAELEALGAVSNARIFRLGSDYTERSAKLKAGSFLVPAGASMEQIADLLTVSGQSTCGAEVNFRIGVTLAELQLREIVPETGRFEVIEEFAPDAPRPAAYQDFLDRGFGSMRVTVAEGVTSWQISNALGQLDILEGSVDAVPAEGMLAPGSYDIAPGDARGDILAEMTRRQTALLDEAWATRSEGLPYATKEEALTMASIVEKETGVDAERPTVASVFVNRLEQGMRLQTDPTVIYGLTEGKGVLGRGLRASELRRHTPYNTYAIDGLPPGPIANPGAAAIEAALHPAETEYLYFVADGTGGHVFSTTLAEHNANVRKWREIERQQREQTGQ